MSDSSYIRLALELAKKGVGRVSPNPMVGAVLIKNDRIIGTGYHQYFGGDHAEVDAITTAREEVSGSTLYVNLEPCSHFGKRPPCADAIIKEGIKKVVIGCLDPNPLVSGSGVQKLKDAGIEVKVGVLEEECKELNKYFLKFITDKVPYVTLKIAQTLDGNIADTKGYSKWVTSVESRTYVHGLRSEYDAVLVGSSTVKMDNPELNVRYVEGRNPKKIILDTNLSLSTRYRLFHEEDDGGTIIITSKSSQEKKKKLSLLEKLGVNVIFVNELKNGRLNLRQALRELGRANISSVLVEGGGRVFSSFFKHELFDEVLMFISPKVLGEGLGPFSSIGAFSLTKATRLSLKSTRPIGGDVLINYVKK